MGARRPVLGVAAFVAIALGAWALVRGGATEAPTGAAAPSASAATPTPIAKLDFHVHIDAEIAPAARTFLRAHGIGRAVNLSGGWVGAGLEETLAAAGGDPVFANVDFRGIGAPGWSEREVLRLERAKAMGARGVKIPKSLGLRVHTPDGRRVAVDDPLLDALFDAMARLGLPLAIHTGDPRAFFDPPTRDNERYEELGAHPAWSFSDRSVYPTWDGLLGELERRVARSSRTTIVSVHFGNAPEEPARVARWLDRYPNLWVDTAARVPELGHRAQEARAAILAHPDRVLFGTDLQFGSDGSLVLGAGEGFGHRREGVERFFNSSWRFFETRDRGFAHPTPIQGAWTIDGIGLPRDVLERVYHANAERLLGLGPTPL